MQTTIAQPSAFTPLASVSVGLGWGLSAELGTTWQSGNGSTTDGFEPYLGARIKLYGRSDGMGFSLATGARFRWAGGFSPGHPEVELHATAQYRANRFELGGDLVGGQAIGAPDRDIEFRTFALVHVNRFFGLGLGGQYRVDLAQDTLPTMGPLSDLRGGLFASITYDRVQVGLLLGASNYQLPSNTSVSPYGQAMVGYVFN